jgi:hypothetical protein
MKKIGGIESITIGDQTFNVADFENTKPMTFTINLDKEYWEQYAKQQRDKLFEKAKVQFIDIDI